MLDIRNCDGLDLLDSLDDKSVDLILTDPPYIISRDSGMQDLRNKIDTGTDLTKTEEEWEEFSRANPDPATFPNAKHNYMKFGTVYGTKFASKTQFGAWDDEFTMDTLEAFVSAYYKKLRDGGTCIIWFDLWKLTQLKEVMEKVGFKQLRFIEWIKTNPQPLNSQVNYLTNAREIAVLGVKKGKPTFHGKHDVGIYHHAIAHGKKRFHPTQKPLKLFEALVEKHSNPGDLVVDTFLGSGTTALACKNLGRRCVGSEISEEYFSQIEISISGGI